MRFHSTKYFIVIPFYHGLHCDSFLQRITLGSPATEDYIVIPFHRRLHCHSLLQSIKDTLWFPLHSGRHCDFLLQEITLSLPSTPEKQETSQMGPITNTLQFLSTEDYHCDTLLQRIGRDLGWLMGSVGWRVSPNTWDGQSVSASPIQLS